MVGIPQVHHAVGPNTLADHDLWLCCRSLGRDPWGFDFGDEAAHKVWSWLYWRSVGHDPRGFGLGHEAVGPLRLTHATASPMCLNHG